ncbi:MAG: tripartite tricarboxylate transporter substrate binding protein [Piscinibacter sp.]|nr:tripartite tricarboxylate transporter substrate binding protein [Piscinibacter sp.]
MRIHPTRRAALLAAVAFGSRPGLLRAQTAAEAGWPGKPVKLIVPFAPGGPTDTVARLLAERLQAQWKQTVVIDYKPGAGTMVGTQFVATSPPDGYTLGMAISAHMINPSLQPKIPYDTQRDLAGVSQIALAHFGLFAHPSLPVSSVTELVAYAKSHPRTLNYATPGVGTGTHLAGEMLNHMAGLDLQHVAYKGSAPAQQDVLAGRVPLLFDVLYSSMPLVKDGRLKVLGLASPHRSAANPEVPLINDAVPGFSAMSIIGVIAPAGVPRELRRRIGADIAAAVRSPELGERLTSLGMEAVGSSADDYDALIKVEIDKWAGVIKRAGIKLE